MQYEVTFTFATDNEDDVQFIIDRIVENYEALAYSGPTLVPPEDEIETYDNDADDDKE